MDDAMRQRVAAELRRTYPHDSDEMLESMAERTTVGAATAFRLQLDDLGRDLARKMRPLVDVMKRFCK